MHILLLLLILNSVQALSEMDFIKKGEFSDGSLVSEIELNASFNTSPATVEMMIEVINPGDEEMRVFIGVEEDGGWRIVDIVGSVPPRSTSVLTYNATFEYSGSTVYQERIALIAEEDGTLVGKTFSLTERWEAYERYLRRTLSKTFLFLFPGSVSLILILSIAVFYIARKRRVGGEYTLMTLFLPHIKGRPVSEAVADIMLNPIFWLLEIFCGSLLVITIFISSATQLSMDIAFMTFLLGGGVAFALPLLYLLIAWWADVYEPEPLRFPFSMFLWGIFSGFIAFILNTLMDILLGTSVEFLFGKVWVALLTVITAIFIAPLVEESVKGFGVFVASWHHELNNLYDGILYGFAVGLGFSAVENWMYIAVQNNPAAVGGIEAWIFLMAYRALFNSLGHGWFTACIGAIMGYAKFDPKLKGYASIFFIPAVLVAASLHALFNFFAALDGVIRFITETPFFLFNPLLLLATTIFFVALSSIAILRTRKDRC